MTTIENRLNSIRNKVAELVAQKDGLEWGRLSRDEAIAGIDAFIELQASRQPGGSLDFSKQLTQPEGFMLDKDTPNAAPWFCSLMPDLVRQSLMDRLPKDESEYGPETRSCLARIAKIEQRVYDLEVQEEQLVLQLRNSGKECNRRVDITNPLVLILKTTSVGDALDVEAA